MEPLTIIPLLALAPVNIVCVPVKVLDDVSMA
jgi:hypothetical protein